MECVQLARQKDMQEDSYDRESSNSLRSCTTARYAWVSIWSERRKLGKECLCVIVKAQTNNHYLRTHVHLTRVVVPRARDVLISTQHDPYDTKPRI